VKLTWNDYMNYLRGPRIVVGVAVKEVFLGGKAMGLMVVRE
jgi:hypothetical protein